MSKIQWTERTWNPIVGCSVVSPGCTNCYAMNIAARLLDKPGGHYEGTTKRVNGKPVWTGKIAAAPEHTLLAPLKRRKPTTWFVNSMGDLFHKDVPVGEQVRVFAVMEAARHHVFQVLTKRPDIQRRFMNAAAGYVRKFGIDALISHGYQSGPWPPLNVWLGTSCEDQKRFGERWPELARTPAAIRFISFEPMLGPIDCGWMHGSIVPDWVIIGGESGHGARAMHMAWARSIVEQCRSAGVPVFVKQLGASPFLKDRKGGDMSEWPEDLRVREMPA